MSTPVEGFNPYVDRYMPSFRLAFAYVRLSRASPMPLPLSISLRPPGVGRRGARANAKQLCVYFCCKRKRLHTVGAPQEDAGGATPAYGAARQRQGPSF